MGGELEDSPGNQPTGKTAAEIRDGVVRVKVVTLDSLGKLYDRDVT
jgi:hypothetical protein